MNILVSRPQLSNMGHRLMQTYPSHLVLAMIYSLAHYGYVILPVSLTGLALRTHGHSRRAAAATPALTAKGAA